MRVGCPESGCIKARRTPTRDEVCSVVSEEMAKRWRWLTQKRLNEMDPTGVDCPIALCGAFVPSPYDGVKLEHEVGDQKLRICQACNYPFCSMCRRGWCATSFLYPLLS